MFLKGGRKLSLRLPLLVAGLLMAGMVLATPTSDDELTDENPDIPLDGGLSVLLVAGAALGGKKVYDLRKKEKKTLQ